MKIAIAGVQRSGKSWLAAKLAIATTGQEITEVGAPLADVLNFDMVFLMGLDLIPLPTDFHGAQRQELATQDQALRDTLAHLGKAFHVIYGSGDARLQAALTAIDSQLTMHSIAGYDFDTRPAGQLASKQSDSWHWPCDKCSDPDCEHQLFSRLLQACGRGL